VREIFGLGIYRNYNFARELTVYNADIYSMRILVQLYPQNLYNKAICVYVYCVCIYAIIHYIIIIVKARVSANIHSPFSR
jgi:hypothetical protein